mgnify:FL=1
MKLLIASDIHGSAYYAKELLAAFDAEKADRLFLLGDVLYHGPRNDLPRDYDPKKVIAMLNERKDRIFCVRGNCDTEVDQMVLEFPLLADYAVVEVAGRLMYATHGHKFTPQNLPLQPGDIFIQGHTHVPCCKKYGEILWLNPGSVAIPKENSHHQYIIYDKGEFIWKDFAGSVLQTYSLEN